MARSIVSPAAPNPAPNPADGRERRGGRRVRRRGGRERRRQIEAGLGAAGQRRRRRAGEAVARAIRGSVAGRARVRRGRRTAATGAIAAASTRDAAAARPSCPARGGPWPVRARRDGGRLRPAASPSCAAAWLAGVDVRVRRAPPRPSRRAPVEAGAPPVAGRRAARPVGPPGPGIRATAAGACAGCAGGAAAAVRPARATAPTAVGQRAVAGAASAPAPPAADASTPSNVRCGRRPRAAVRERRTRIHGGHGHGRRRGAAAGVAIDGHRARRHPARGRRAAASAPASRPASPARSGPTASPRRRARRAATRRRPRLRRPRTSGRGPRPAVAWHAVDGDAVHLVERERDQRGEAVVRRPRRPREQSRHRPRGRCRAWRPATGAPPGRGRQRGREIHGAPWKSIGESIRTDAYRFICSVSTRISSAVVMLRELAW